MIPSHSWILNFPRTSVPSVYSGIQSAVIRILQPVTSVRDMPGELLKKLKVTLGDDLFGTLVFDLDWFTNLEFILGQAPIFLRVCWLKAAAGAWCTTIRMHNPCTWSCIFGCSDARDEFVHYLRCPILWHFAREALKIQEDSIFIGSRLCLVEPSIQKLKLLAFTHSLYHSLKNDPRCIGQDGHPVNANSMQLAATDICRSLRFSFPESL